MPIVQRLNWIRAWFLGILVGAALFLIDARLLMAINVLPGTGSGVAGVFMKNLIASLSTIYLGLALCYLELQVFTRVSGKTYAFLERLTDPLYKLLLPLNKTFGEVKPFYRSCLFYLLFVPNLSLFLNGVVPGFILILQPKLLLPHGILEIPLMLASAKMAFSIKEDLEEAIMGANIDSLKGGMKKGFSLGRLKRVAALEAGLWLASYVEVNFAF